MPRKVEPRWEWDGGSKRPRVTLAADQRARIRDSIGLTEAQIEEIAPDVEEAASTYLRRRRQDKGPPEPPPGGPLTRRGRDQEPRAGAPTVAEQNAALGVLVKELGRPDVSPSEVVGLLLALDAESGWLLRTELGYRPLGPRRPDGGGAPRLHGIDIDEVRAAAERALEQGKKGKKRTGPPKPITLYLLVDDLVAAYEWVTEKTVTHNPYKKVEYVGHPLSEAGRFVGAAMAEINRIDDIEPKVPETTVSNVLAKVVSARISKRHA